MRTMGMQVGQMLARIREQRPLIHHITNLVVMNDTANITLMVGASPVMAHAAEEAAEMASMAGALVLNPGTLTREWVESMMIAGRQANNFKVPIVLDPVGAGATSFRMRSNQQMLDGLSLQVVRGNAGEIGSLSGLGGTVKGVDSVEAASEPDVVARHMARERSTVVAITGQRDVISDGTRTLGVDNGHPWLTHLTGTGCMATAMIAAFAAVERDYLVAAAGALATYGLAAELAAERTSGPASFKVALFDHLYHLTPEQVAGGVRIVEMG
ncbi:MAG: hydroxyethylthiazole kinase [Chloroflexaceae bacterium]|nr:hydroxyethylthiazole kinase [Chloroflexaceae bacterium]